MRNISCSPPTTAPVFEIGFRDDSNFVIVVDHAGRRIRGD